MNISLNDILKSFQGQLPMNLKLLSNVYQVSELVIDPEKTSPLYILNSKNNPISLHLPLDTYIGMETLLNKQYFPQGIRMLNEIIKEVDASFTLVDIGANIGLYSRQSIHILKKIKNIHAYEPHPDNFKLLKKNLLGIETAELNNYGLGVKTGVLDFYLDGMNRGNNSLNMSAMS